MKQLLYLILLSVLISCASQNNIVVDEASAIRIAEEALFLSMGKDELESLQPFRAILRDNRVWEVFPRDIAEFGGLLPIVYIKKNNGKVVKVSRGGDIPREAMPVK